MDWTKYTREEIAILERFEDAYYRGKLMAHKTIDRRGGKNPKPTELCRICGSRTVHCTKYNGPPTMKCIHVMREERSLLMDQLMIANKRINQLEKQLKRKGQ